MLGLLRSSGMARRGVPLVMETLLITLDATLDLVPSTAPTSDDLDTQMAPVQILLFVAALFIYVRTFYTCS